MGDVGSEAYCPPSDLGGATKFLALYGGNVGDQSDPSTPEQASSIPHSTKIDLARESPT